MKLRWVPSALIMRVLFAFNTLLFLACTQPVQTDPKDPAIVIDVERLPIDLKGLESPTSLNFEMWKGANYDLALDTREYFLIMDEMRRIRDLTTNPKLKHLLNQSIQKFYEQFYGRRDGKSYYNEVRTPYLETALFQEKDSLYSRSSETFKSAIDAVKAAKNSWKGLKIENLETISFQEILLKIIAHLDQMKLSLKAHGLVDDIYEEIEEKFSREIQPQLKLSSQNLSQLSEKSDIEENLAILTNTIQNLTLLSAHSREEQGYLLKEMRTLSGLAKRALGSREILQVIIEIWILPAEFDSKTALQKSSPLFSKILSFFNEEDYEWMKLNKDRIFEWSRPLVSGFLLTSTKLIDLYGVEKARGELLTALNQAVLTRTKRTLAQEAMDLPQRMATILTENLYEEQKDFLQSFSKNLRTVGEKEMRMQIFQQKTDLPALEYSDAHLVSQAKGWLLKPGVTPVTGAGTIGASLLVANRIVLDHENLVNPFLSNHESFFQLTFNQLNKMLAICGTQTLEGYFVQSLTRPLDPLLRKPFDIFGYSEKSEFFGVPDRIPIEKGFDVEIQTVEQNTFSVLGQAELLLGTSEWLYYFRDWFTTEYDRQLGSVLYKGVKVLPKHSFYTVSLGVASIMLRNIKKKALTLLPGSVARQSGDSSVYAALSDVSPESVSSIAKTYDIGRMILALESFLNATDGFEKSKSTAVQREVGGEKVNFNALIDARKQIKLLTVGLGNLITGKLQSSDGGVAPEFHLQKHMPQGVRTFRDQIAAARALMAVSRVSGGEGYRNAAHDVIAFLSRKMRDPETGYFRGKENVSAIPSFIDHLSVLAVMREARDDRLTPALQRWELSLERYLDLADAL